MSQDPPSRSGETQAQRAQAALAALAQQGLARHCPEITERRGTEYKLDGRRVVGFCSNDYLGLALAPPARPPSTTKSAAGSTASQLICGRSEVHRRVEARIAELADAEDAVLFPSAFQANVGVLPLLLGAEHRVFSDRLNHASLIDGLRLARATTTILDHRQSPQVDPHHPTWWITESIFSMDGTYAHAGAISEFQSEGGSLYLDDAHAFGLGHGGRSCAPNRASLTVVGLGKALGCAGGAVASDAHTCAWIRSAARSFVFTTGISPLITEHIEAALGVLVGKTGDARRETLQRHTERVATALGRSEARHIVPLLVGDNQRALNWSAALLDHGFHVQAIRPPTVPHGTARLRLTLSAAHGDTQVAALCEALERTAGQLGIPWPPPSTPAPPTGCRKPHGTAGEDTSLPSP